MLLQFCECILQFVQCLWQIFQKLLQLFKPTLQLFESDLQFVQCNWRFIGFFDLFLYLFALKHLVMLALNVLKLLEDRGIINPQTYLVKNGIPYYTVSRLVTNKTKNITYATLEKLCLICKCTPDDLFVWVADADLQLAEPVALEKLKPKPKPLSTAERMKNLSAEQLEQLQRFINELEKK